MHLALASQTIIPPAALPNSVTHMVVVEKWRQTFGFSLPSPCTFNISSTAPPDFAQPGRVAGMCGEDSSQRV